MIHDWSVPRMFQGETVFLIGGGPSVDLQVLPFLPDRAPTIAINSAFEDCPEADVCFWSDQRWLRWNVDKLSGYHGIKICRHPDFTIDTRGQIIHRLRNRTGLGLSTDPQYLHGVCSGAAALNLAFLMGAARIVLIGYDMSGGQYHDRHKVKTSTSAYETYMRHFPPMATALERIGVEVFNVSKQSKLKCFPYKPLKDFI